MLKFNFKKIIYVLLICISSQGAMATDNLIVYGAGTISCGKFTELYTTKNWGYADAGGTWIDGYITGIQDNNGVDLKKVDSSASKAFIIKYCADNPLDNLRKAAWELVIKLVI